MKNEGGKDGVKQSNEMKSRAEQRNGPGNMETLPTREEKRTVGQLTLIDIIFAKKFELLRSMKRGGKKDRARTTQHFLSRRLSSMVFQYRNHKQQQQAKKQKKSCVFPRLMEHRHSSYRSIPFDVVVSNSHEWRILSSKSILDQ